MINVRFARRVNVPFDVTVARLEEWSASRGDGEIRIGRSHLRWPPAGEGDEDGRHVQVVLGRGPLRPSVVMELEVLPWSDALGTSLELVPRTRIHPTDGYFEEGHRLLDRLAAVIDAKPLAA